ncbi:MAG: ATP-binding cassette domain-containing protein, partial [Proteobacteria bacterium]
MSTLFANNNEGGYRLRSFEVFNWGTFDGRVYKITPNGRTSLLTGANGSGKTTLVDALLTLLVPSGKRFYNQSSGAESKKERDELSYFWGYFGKTFSDAEEVSKTEQLRHKSDNHYSVLLGCFQNSATLHTITLVQVRWFSGGGLKKVFVFSPYPLSISEHFGKGQFDLKGEWRKKLSKIHPKTEFFDSFKEYSSRFSEAFGLGEKALSLFNQTVGIKVLGDLTAFVRSHMLEEPNSESQFSDLYSHYSDLLLAYKAIQKDEAQLNLLSPIIETGEKLGEVDVLKESYSLIDTQAEHFLNALELDLLDSFIELKEVELNAKQSDKRNLESIGVELTNKKDSLVSQKAALNIDGQMQLLRQRKNSETEWKVTKERVFREYETRAVHLNLNTDLNAEIFLKNYSKVLELSSDSLTRLENLRDDRGELKTKIKIEEDRIEECQRQISYY